MKKNFKLGLAALMACLSISAVADNSLSWHGYMRSSLGFNSDLEDLNKVDVNSLGRFGNEYDDFINSILVKRWEGENGTWANYNLGLLVAVDEVAPSNITNSFNFVEMGGFGFLPESSSVWVGKRKIVSGVSILDYDYRKFNGRGFGFKSKFLELNFFKEFHKFDMGQGPNAIDEAAVDAVYKIGNLETEVTYTKVTDENLSNNGDTSVSVLAAYKHDKLLFAIPGSTTYRVQFGNGVDATHLNMGYVGDTKDTAYRFTVDGSYSANNWAINPVILAEGTNDDSKDVASSTITVGARATNALNENVSMIYEAVYSNIENKNSTETADGSEYKIAAGPALQLKSAPFVRPIIRLSATLLGGDKEVTGLTEDSELRFGAQFETWF